jgi:hypothetical protein
LSEEATAILCPRLAALLDICHLLRGDRPATSEFSGHRIAQLGQGRRHYGTVIVAAKLHCAGRDDKG